MPNFNLQYPGTKLNQDFHGNTVDSSSCHGATEASGPQLLEPACSGAQKLQLLKPMSPSLNAAPTEPRYLEPTLCNWRGVPVLCN